VWHVPHIYGPYSLVPPSRLDLEGLAERQLGEAVTKFGLGDTKIELLAKSGHAVRILEAEAEARDASMLVVGSRGHGGFAGLLVGSVSEDLAQRPRQPLVVLRPSDRTRSHDAGEGRGEHRTVVGLDGSSNSTIALQWALDNAARQGGSVDAVMVWPPPLPDVAILLHDETDLIARAEQGARDALATQISEAGDASGVEVRQWLREGHPAQVLLEAAEGADLLVVGTHGLTGWARLGLGSISRAVLHHAHVPVAIIPDIVDSEPVDGA
jgi:nucleotide-binding universal stress UspA family protein